MRDGVRELLPEEQVMWDDYVTMHPDAGPYHRTAWLEAVRRAYGFSSLALGYWRDGGLIGVLPLVRHVVPTRKAVLTSLPFCDFGDALGDSPEDVALLREYALASARCAGERLDLRRPVYSVSGGKERHKGDWEGHSDKARQTYQGGGKVLMRLPLPESAEALWQSFRSKLRSQVNRPVKSGMVCQSGDKELLDAFYRVYVHNMRDLGSPPHARGWFDQVLCCFGGDARVFVVHEASGQPVAASLLLLNGKTATVPWASSLRKWNSQSPNMLLYWTMLEYAAQKGCGMFDFGRSTPGEGTYHFKAQWGARPVELHWERYQPDGSVEIISTSNRISRSRELAEMCWQRLPVAVSTLAGTALRRYISL